VALPILDEVDQDSHGIKKRRLFSRNGRGDDGNQSLQRRRKKRGRLLRREHGDDSRNDGGCRVLRFLSRFVRNTADPFLDEG
jgi:hypothetical protein